MRTRSLQPPLAGYLPCDHTPIFCVQDSPVGKPVGKAAVRLSDKRRRRAKKTAAAKAAKAEAARILPAKVLVFVPKASRALDACLVTSVQADAMAAEESNAPVARIFARVQADAMRADKDRRQRNVRGQRRKNQRRKQRRKEQREAARRADIEAALPAARRLLAQQTEVCRVLAAAAQEDWRAVLGFESGTAVDAQGLRRAYMAECLAVHPDKNHAPDAGAAFTALQRAQKFMCAHVSSTAVGHATGADAANAANATAEVCTPPLPLTDRSTAVSDAAPAAAAHDVLPAEVVCKGGEEGDTARVQACLPPTPAPTLVHPHA